MSNPENLKLLKYEHDMYGGVRINTSKQEYDLTEFEERLIDSITLWTETKVGGVWIKIEKSHSHLVPICTNQGFDFHHAQPGYVMMTKWLPLDQPSILPGYANQYLGCAGFVINSNNQVLVVKERYSSSLAKWKLPGGHAEIGEDFGEAAIRETREETGIECEFVSLLCVRHMHGYRHGLSDLYAICLLKPLTETISMDDQELTHCQWMDVEEWLQGDLTPTNRYIGELYAEISRGEAVALTANSVPSYNYKKHNLIYSAPRPGAT